MKIFDGNVEEQVQEFIASSPHPFKKVCHHIACLSKIDTTTHHHRKADHSPDNQP